MDAQVSDEDILSLTDALTNGSSQDRLAALQSLGAIERTYPAIIPALIAALKDPDVAVRLAIAQAIERRGEPALTALIEQLREARGLLREAILNTIVLIGPPARAAVPILTELGDDPLAGPLVLRALRSIRHGKPTNWRRVFDSLSLAILLGGLLLEVLCEVLSWLGTFSRAQGMAYQIAIAWLAIGAYLGAVIGTRFGGGFAMHIGAKVFGLLCAAVGALVGRMLGRALEPLVKLLE